MFTIFLAPTGNGYGVMASLAWQLPSFELFQHYIMDCLTGQYYKHGGHFYSDGQIDLASLKQILIDYSVISQ